MESGFWIFIAEGALALAIAAFIVWWTFPKRPPREDDRPRPR